MSRAEYGGEVRAGVSQGAGWLGVGWMDMDIKEVARRAEVSPATVERVMRVVEKLHYVPNTSARNLRTGSTRLLGMIVSDINNPFFSRLVDGIESLARERGVGVICSHTDYSPARLREALERMVEHNVDGIAVCTSETAAAAYEFARRRRCAVALLGQEGPRTEYANVRVDYAAGLQEAVEHLRGLGHKRIAYIGGPTTFESTRARRQGFLKVMKAAGLELRPEWMVEADLHMDGGGSAMEKLLATRARPTAVVAANDLMALGALRAAHGAGLNVPQEMSLVGYDNLPICEMVTPPLDSIEIPRTEVVAGLFAMLQPTNGGKKAATAKTLTAVRTRFIRRNSSAAAPQF